jgi:peroxiredoxin
MPATDDFATGPTIGEKLPDFTLPNQYGEPVNFSTAREGKGALVVFQRSSRW